ncbi:MAG TPA: hypothetical protein VKX16_04590 [Chloroflexota bacterium]|nr:hypothetical protein [Chloroflexota bacterium]
MPHSEHPDRTTRHTYRLEEDAVSTLVQSMSTAHLVVRTTQRWSHWNGPRLTTPAVPAS